ncbi:copper-transporting ATPase RAN1, partial [Tanacetum coccineum]
VGNISLLAKKGVTILADVGKVLVDLEENAKTGILVAYDSELIDVVGVAYPLKKEAAIVVELFDHITFWSRNVFHISQ